MGRPVASGQVCSALHDGRTTAPTKGARGYTRQMTKRPPAPRPPTPRPPRDHSPKRYTQTAAPPPRVAKPLPPAHPADSSTRSLRAIDFLLQPLPPARRAQIRDYLVL